MTLATEWHRNSDYSHGYLVVPITLLFLWARRAEYPGVQRVPDWAGLALLLAAIAVRVVGARFFLTPLGGWSLILWLAAACCTVMGRRVFLWALPAIAFLFFMVPLPFQIEQLLSWPLQRVATQVSCWILQFLGQPAVAEGNVVYLGEHRLLVEEACSGLRMLVGTAALAYALGVLIKRSWWESVLLFAAIAPVSLLANSVRVAVVGLAFQYSATESAHQFAHDLAGWLVIPLAAVMMWTLLAYSRRLIVQSEQVAAYELLRAVEQVVPPAGVPLSAAERNGTR